MSFAYFSMCKGIPEQNYVFKYSKQYDCLIFYIMVYGIKTKIEANKKSSIESIETIFIMWNKQNTVRHIYIHSYIICIIILCLNKYRTKTTIRRHIIINYCIKMSIRRTYTFLSTISCITFECYRVCASEHCCRYIYLLICMYSGGKFIRYILWPWTWRIYR